MDYTDGSVNVGSASSVCDTGDRVTGTTAPRDRHGEAAGREPGRARLTPGPAHRPTNHPRDRAGQGGVSAPPERRIPSDTHALLCLIGCEADRMRLPLYVAGGFVRDLLLDRPTSDLDVVVEGNALEFARRLAESRGWVCVEFSRFRTATVVLPDQAKIDIATARSEHYPRSGALPEVAPGSIRNDLYRRDFTINAMAMKLNSGVFGELLDPFDGRKDLENRCVRVLHAGSFLDDPTRILRAVRFEQRFDFRIEGKTRRLLRSAATPSVLRSVSPQRLRREVVLMAQEPGVDKAFRRLDALGPLRAIHPGLTLNPLRRQILARLERRLEWYHSLDLGTSVEDWVVYLQVLLVGLRAERRRAAARRLALHRRVVAVADQVASKATRVLSRLSSAQDWRPSAVYFALKPFRAESVLFLMAMTASQRALRHLCGYVSSLQFHKIAVSGRDLTALGLPPGPAHARVLRRVQAAELNGGVHTRPQQLAFAARLVQRSVRQ